MTKFRNLLLGATLAATAYAGAAQAQPYDHQGPPPPYYHHHWHPGDRYDGPRMVVRHWRHYHLAPPPYGYYWVQDEGRFILIAPSGLIARIYVP